jgi:hypothetical protein
MGEHHESTHKTGLLPHLMKRDDFSLFPALFKEDYSSTIGSLDEGNHTPSAI